ncbi:hypothetical protein BU15DRAFT_65942 [Melanogaster broomeanus]|nr:hypothetical protein BU15DRAFT_65942 [Melanogaster broomeanus]
MDVIPTISIRAIVGISGGAIIIAPLQIHAFGVAARIDGQANQVPTPSPSALDVDQRTPASSTSNAGVRVGEGFQCDLEFSLQRTAYIPASTSDKQHTTETIGGGAQALKSKRWHAADAAMDIGPTPKRQCRALDKQHITSTVGDTAQAQHQALDDQAIIRRSGHARHPPKAPDEDVATPSHVKTKAKAHQRQ